MNTKLLGSSFIIAGTALGAGMLAIPMVLAQFGLVSGTLLMLLIWLGTTYAALLLLESSIKAGGGFSMNTIAKQTLGKSGQLVTNGLLYALLICLLMAYIIGAGDLLHKLITSFNVPISMTQSQVLFTLAAGLIVAAGTSTIDKINRAMFSVMIVLLAFSLVYMAPSISFDNLQQITNSNRSDLIKTSSILFTSFGFMVVIPSLVNYNDGANHKQLRNMVIVGSLIPLFCYLIWLYVVVGNLNTDQLSQFTNVSDLLAVLSAKYGHISSVLSIFTGLALLTSFLGVAMALFDQNLDTFKQNRVVTYCISFVLPLLGALFAANHFLAALNYAGFILVFLAIFIPLAMTIKVRGNQNTLSNDEAQGTEVAYQAEGGVLALILTFAFGCFLLSAQIS
ncbi:MAG: tyrosine transporter [Aliivibrio sp.]|uniref:amino acid permease n=1 Tax=Aliivibrio sp. TaxID=1872443 RepID=UPI001A4F0933|nr:tyrosine transporter [Aliivibrio sp.]